MYTYEPPKEESRLIAVAQAWRPPEALDAKGLFRATVTGYTFTKEDAETALPEFSFERSGRHATYTLGTDTIDVFAYRPVTKPEVKALWEILMKDLTATKGPADPKLSGNNSQWVYHANTGQVYRVFPKNDWLIVVRSTQAAPSATFAADMLEAMTAGAKE